MESVTYGMSICTSRHIDEVISDCNDDRTGSEQPSWYRVQFCRVNENDTQNCLAVFENLRMKYFRLQEIQAGFLVKLFSFNFLDGCLSRTSKIQDAEDLIQVMSGADRRRRKTGNLHGLWALFGMSWNRAVRPDLVLKRRVIRNRAAFRILRLSVVIS